MVLVSGCGRSLEDIADQVNREWNALLTVLQGGRNPLLSETGKKAPLKNPEALIHQCALQSKANAELLHEIYEVVFIREPKDKAFFGTYVDTLNQGASLEGIYNGFTHSSAYRQLEMVQTGAKPKALHVFAEELFMLESALPAPTVFDEKSAKPLPLAVSLSADPLPVETASPATIPFGVAQYSRIFASSSVYTMKRVLGDEALKVIAAKKSVPRDLSLWYGKWVVHMGDRKVDFGVPLRNSADESFHAKWLLSVSEDRVTWEVLNRIHRVLNEANQ